MPGVRPKDMATKRPCTTRPVASRRIIDERTESLSCSGLVTALGIEEPLDIEKVVSDSKADDDPIAAPAPVPRPGGEPGSNRIESKVAAKLQKMTVIGNEPRAKTALEDVAGESVAIVEPSPVCAVKPLHARRQILFRRLERQM